jgi:deoxyribonuclease V
VKKRRPLEPRSPPRIDPVWRNSEIPDLYAALHELLRQIPAGRVTTYGALAEALGAVAAARWVATCLLDPAGPPDLPRHRVVLRDGALGESWTGRRQDKSRLLASERVTLCGESVDLRRYGFDASRFVATRPLQTLQRIQEQLLDRLDLRPPSSMPEFAGGVDVSYAGMDRSGPIQGVAAYVVVHVATGELVWSRTVEQTVHFPYIPGFLAFRELPILLELLEQVRRDDRLTDIVLVDGNGILHQRHAGIASHLGIVADIATIGIGKSLLCGAISREAASAGLVRPVVFQGKTVASALETQPAGKSIYVSPGQRVDLPFAVELTRRLLRGRGVPEPIFHAHSISRSAIRRAIASQA